MLGLATRGWPSHRLPQDGASLSVQPVPASWRCLGLVSFCSSLAAVAVRHCELAVGETSAPVLESYQVARGRTPEGEESGRQARRRMTAFDPLRTLGLDVDHFEDLAEPHHLWTLLDGPLTASMNFSGKARP